MKNLQFYRSNTIAANRNAAIIALKEKAKSLTSNTYDGMPLLYRYTENSETKSVMGIINKGKLTIMADDAKATETTYGLVNGAGNDVSISDGQITVYHATNSNTANYATNAGSAESAKKLISIDHRAYDATPSYFGPGFYADFKNKDIISIPGNSNYVGQLTFRPYGHGNDFSGGPTHQLLFAQNNNIYHRTGSEETWNAVDKILSDNNTYIKESSGKLAITVSDNIYNAATYSHTHDNYAENSVVSKISDNLGLIATRNTEAEGGFGLNGVFSSSSYDLWNVLDGAGTLINDNFNKKVNTTDYATETTYGLVAGKGDYVNINNGQITVLDSDKLNKKPASDYQLVENAVGKKTAQGGEIFNDYVNNAAGKNSHAEGDTAKATGEACHAEGFSTHAEGLTSHAEGRYTYAIGIASHAEGGDGSHAGGYGSHVEGVNTKSESTARAGHAEGEGSIVSGESAHAEGWYSDAKGNYSHTEGESTLSIGEGSHSEGIYDEGVPFADSYQEVFSKQCDYNTLTKEEIVEVLQRTKISFSMAFGYASHSEGLDNAALGDASHAEGRFTISNGRDSHTEGNTTEAHGEASHAEGNTTKANADSSHSEGEITVAIGKSSHSEGNRTKAMGEASHTEGSGKYKMTTQVFPLNYTSERNGNLIVMDYDLTSEWSSKVGKAFKVEYKKNNNGEYILIMFPDIYTLNSVKYENGGTTFNFDKNIPLGIDYSFGVNLYLLSDSQNIAKGIASHAEGNCTTADGIGAHAEGINTITRHNGEHAEGNYNISNNSDNYKTRSSIGIGTVTDRKNGFELLENGQLYINGIGNYNGILLNVLDVQTGLGSGTKLSNTQSLQEVIADIYSKIGNIATQLDAINGEVI